MHGWTKLIEWLEGHGLDREQVRVAARDAGGAGYGLFATEDLPPNTAVMAIPAGALLNRRTLSRLYPGQEKLSAMQMIALHLLLHQPCPDADPDFGAYLAVLPTSFASHPLTWLVNGASFPLPEGVNSALDRMAGLFEADWADVKAYLHRHPLVAQRRQPPPASKTDFLCAWLNVNTRCVYHRLAPSRSSPDNISLCPILDFANHANTPPFASPQSPQAPNNFVLLSPSTPLPQGHQLFLRYGSHPNPTLFAEYGFVHLHEYDGQVNVDHILEAAFQQKPTLKDLLSDQGYWRDWTMHATPHPPHPSFRLITALRLYHLFPEDSSIPESDRQPLLDAWHQTISGHTSIVSDQNELSWMAGLNVICQQVQLQSEQGLEKTQTFFSNFASEETWLASTKMFIQALWREQIEVAKGVQQSLNEHVQF